MGYNDWELSNWEHAGFDRDEAVAWREAGFSLYLAFYCQLISFTLRDAENWQKRGFTPEDAVRWYDAGFTSEEAASWRDAGFGGYFGRDDAHEWRAAGFTLSEAVKWRKAGYTPVEAVRERNAKSIAKSESSSLPEGVHVIEETLPCHKHIRADRKYPFGECDECDARYVSQMRMKDVGWLYVNHCIDSDLYFGYMYAWATWCIRGKEYDNFKLPLENERRKWLANRVRDLAGPVLSFT